MYIFSSLSIDDMICRLTSNPASTVLINVTDIIHWVIYWISSET